MVSSDAGAGDVGTNPYRLALGLLAAVLVVALIAWVGTGFDA